MKKKKEVISENLLEKIPVRSSLIEWKTDEEGIVTLEIKNTGWANKLAQLFFNRPKISYVHLDRFGSFVWQIIDSESDIIKLGKRVEEEFGEEVNPLYERLAKYFKILESYHFIQLL